MQDNRLESIPEEVFSLSSLTTLDVSNNKLSELPFQMWRSPKLKELNAAFNLLRELPAPSVEVIFNFSFVRKIYQYGLKEKFSLCLRK